VLAGSASKAYAMTGWRCGWTIAPKELSAAFNVIQGQTTSNITSITQKAALAAITGPQDAVGVTLTQQERERINENRTGNLLAFLAYGRGLESMDRGNFQQASTFFRQASQLDPNFAPVQEAAQEAGDLEQASTEAPAEVAQQEQGAPAGGETLAQSMNNEVNGSPATDLTAPQSDPAPPPTTNVIQNQAGNINNAQGQANSAGNAAKATIRLVIPRPGT
jgi:hypothetical protein